MAAVSPVMTAVSGLAVKFRAHNGGIESIRKQLSNSQFQNWVADQHSQTYDFVFSNILSTAQKSFQALLMSITMTRDGGLSHG